MAERVERLLAQQRELERQLQQLRRKLAGSQSDDLLRRRRSPVGRLQGARGRGRRCSIDSGCCEMADRLRDTARLRRRRARQRRGRPRQPARGGDQGSHRASTRRQASSGRSRRSSAAAAAAGRSWRRPAARTRRRSRDALEAARELFAKGVTTALQAAPTHAARAPLRRRPAHSRPCSATTTSTSRPSNAPSACASPPTAARC